MVHVIASVQLKPGKRDEFIALFKSNLPTVKAEKGCIKYLLAVDLPTGLPPQVLDENGVAIIETWETLDSLQAHLGTPHMSAFFEKEKQFIDSSTIKILQEA